MISDFINQKREEFNCKKEFFTNPIYNEQRKKLMLEEKLKEEEKEYKEHNEESVQPVVIQQLIPVQAPSNIENTERFESIRSRLMIGVKEKFSQAKKEGHIFTSNPNPKLLNPVFHGKKGQGFISIIFFTLIFIIVWVLFFAEQLAFWGHQAVLLNGLTGVEALFYNNVNMIVLFVLMIFILGLGYFGFGGRD